MKVYEVKLNLARDGETTNLATCPRATEADLKQMKKNSETDTFIEVEVVREYEWEPPSSPSKLQLKLRAMRAKKGLS